MIRRVLFRSALLIAGMLALPAAAEQIILYERNNFSGRNITVERDMPNLDHLGFGNRASSAYVMSGTWELCTDAYYQGSCRTLTPGEHRSLGSQSNRVSSLRPVRDWGGGGNPGGGWGGSGGAEVVLYDGQNFQGQIGVLRTATPNFEHLGVNDRVASLIVRRGTWEFCTDAHYRNNCRVYGPGRYAQIWGGQDDRYSSARPVGAGGNPGPGPGPGPGGQARIRIFEYPGFSGRSIWLRNSVDSFEQIDFNDRAESIVVEGGEWRLCSDANGEGNCQVFRPGQYPVLPPGLRNSVSSAYRR
ncbi:MAG: beta/gamma crystallin-related protein [Burkholderiales bacterium]|nr:beta/gamma crystallin-related protein [Burkholderiales bacterium]